MATKVILERETNGDGEPSSFVSIRAKGMPWERFGAYVEACEGARYNRERRVSLAPVDKVPTILRRLRDAGFPVDVEPALVRMLQEYTFQQWLDLKGAKERAQRIDEELTKRGMSLYSFQRYGVQWLAAKHAALLADEMGLGKTIQTITAVPASVPVLVVAPAVAKGVWQREVAKWRPHLRVTVLKGRDSFRWPERGEMLVVNYDILPEIHRDGCNGKLPPPPCQGCKVEVNAMGIRVKGKGHKSDCTGFLEAADCPGCAKFLKLAPDDCLIVADEAHNLKSSKARRTKRFRALSETVRSKTGRVWLLTATPLLNNPAELWSVYQAAGIATDAFGTWQNFVRLFKGKSLYFGGYEWGTPEAEVAERIRRVSLRRVRQEVLPELPVKTWRDVVVDVDRKALKECDKFVEEFGGIERIAELIEADGIKFETMSRVRSALAMAKTPALMAMVEDIEAQGEPIVVFSAHRFPIDHLKKRPGWQVITGDTSAAERTAIEDRFQKGELKGVACTIKAGGVAITLTRSHQCLFVDREFTPALNAQAEDRVCRIGQSRGVIVTTLVADHQLDKRLNDIVQAKTALIAASVDAAREQDERNAELDRYATEAMKQLAEDASCGRAVRHPAMTTDEETTLEQLHTVKLRDQDQRVATSLAHEAVTIGLTDAQWKYARALVDRAPKDEESAA